MECFLPQCIGWKLGQTEAAPMVLLIAAVIFFVLFVVVLIGQYKGR